MKAERTKLPQTPSPRGTGQKTSNYETNVRTYWDTEVINGLLVITSNKRTDVIKLGTTLMITVSWYEAQTQRKSNSLWYQLANSIMV